MAREVAGEDELRVVFEQGRFRAGQRPAERSVDFRVDPDRRRQVVGQASREAVVATLQDLDQQLADVAMAFQFERDLQHDPARMQHLRRPVQVLAEVAPRPVGVQRLLAQRVSLGGRVRVTLHDHLPQAVHVVGGVTQGRHVQVASVRQLLQQPALPVVLGAGMAGQQPLRRVQPEACPGRRARARVQSEQLRHRLARGEQVLGQREAQRLQQGDAGVVQVVVRPELAAGLLGGRDGLQPQRVEAVRVGGLFAMARDAGERLHRGPPCVADAGWLALICESDQSSHTWAWIFTSLPKLQPVRICSR